MRKSELTREKERENQRRRGMDGKRGLAVEGRGANARSIVSMFAARGDCAGLTAATERPSGDFAETELSRPLETVNRRSGVAQERFADGFQFQPLCRPDDSWQGVVAAEEGTAQAAQRTEHSGIVTRQSTSATAKAARKLRLRA